jgi:hypothetical protein
MLKNVGSMDRGIRVAFGLALLSIVFIRQHSLRWFGLVGLIPLFTAYLSWCPLYTILGIQTCEKSH